LKQFTKIEDVANSSAAFEARIESPVVSRRPSGFFFLTPVWGESYTRLYVDTVIPAQLANGNLEAFRGEPGNRYIIFTRLEDAEVIRSSAIYGQLNSIVPVTFEFITSRVNVVHDMMTDCYRRGIEAAEKVDAAVIFLTPDIVLSDGSLATIKRLSDAGWNVIYVPAIRTMKKAVAASLEKSFRHGNAVQVSPRQLMRIALDNLHPLADASWWEEGEGGLVPANIYWRVGDGGIVGRCFHLHPIFVYPQRKNVTFFGTVDDDYVQGACPDPSRDFVVSDSDDFLAIELSDPGRFFATRFAKGSVSDTVRWAEHFTNDRHRRLFKVTLRMHTGIVHPKDWSAAEDRAGTVAQKIEARLERPSWRLLPDADLLVRRFIRWGKEYRIKFANRDEAQVKAGSEIPMWKRAVLRAVDAFVDVRRSMLNLMRGIAFRIETLSARSYQAKVYHDLVAMLPEPSDPVLVANNPEKFYLGPLLGRRTPSFSPDRYASLLRRESAGFFEKGEQIANSSNDVIVLEVDAHRTRDLELYLRECRRVLRKDGRLIVYLHRLGFVWSPSEYAESSIDNIIEKIETEFQIVSIRQQGGLGSQLRVKVAAWLRGLVNRRLAVRWLLLIFGLPLLPVILVCGGFFVVTTIALDFIDRSERYYVSKLILTQKKSAPS
jgi:SAM-dependent methyltransferase